MGKNPYWFEQQRAKGICYVCKTNMDDNDPRIAHTSCLKMQKDGKSYKEIREYVTQNGIEHGNNTRS